MFNRECYRNHHCKIHVPTNWGATCYIRIHGMSNLVISQFKYMFPWVAIGDDYKRHHPVLHMIDGGVPLYVEAVCVCLEKVCGKLKHPRHKQVLLVLSCLSRFHWYITLPWASVEVFFLVHCLSLRSSALVSSSVLLFSWKKNNLCIFHSCSNIILFPWVSSHTFLMTPYFIPPYPIPSPASFLLTLIPPSGGLLYLAITP